MVRRDIRTSHLISACSTGPITTHFEFGSLVYGRSPAAAEIGHAEVRYEKAVWLGRSLTSSEHIISLENGIRQVRAVKPLPREECIASEFDRLMKWPMWCRQPAPVQPALPSWISDSAAATELKVPRQKTSQGFAGMKEAGLTGRKAVLRQFTAGCGFTPKCSGCDPVRAYPGQWRGRNKVCQQTVGLPASAQLWNFTSATS